MSYDFSKLKKRKFDVQSLVNEAEKAGGNNKKGDERFWKPTVDQQGNGYAVIRFLPTKEYLNDPAAVPWVRYWDHGFKGPTGKWYIEKSLTSIGQQDPLGELNSRMWATEDPEQQEIVRQRKRRLHHVANILVVDDQGNPDNNGKVFLYQFGKKIFDKIIDVMSPEFPDEDPIVPFDVFGGANFQLKIRQVAGYRNYDKSNFAAPSDLFDGDEKKLEELFDKLYDISEFVDPAKYPSYSELEKKLNDVLGVRKPTLDAATAAAPAMKSAEAKEPEIVESNIEINDETGEDDLPWNDEEDDDVLAHFERLAAES